ncbi:MULTISPECIES: thiolase family protein [unclassified Rhodococcus (in: high G+C Gram-positive bacteria)]|uniref:thiolase family protein n=1 Tax=unclassified Rhodococcus (in: high G+C Gram-positive bacteria) TaxID=192944 RepID=UPI000497C3D9|nr:thiolase family protein [Rhodococcus sp. DK17]
MPLGPLRQVAIVGIGMTEVSRVSERSALDFSAEALRLALDDAGLRAEDVDGLFTNVGYPLAVDYDRMAEAFGLSIRAAVQTWTHGRFVGPALQSAVQAVALGTTDVAACVAGVSFSGLGLVGGAGDAEGLRQGGGSHGELPHYGMTAPGAGAAMAFRRYCARYGQDPGLISAVPIAFRRHARLNPNAQMTKPLEREDYDAQPYVVEPLRRPDFALLSDGGGCLLVTTVERARDLRQPAVVISGMQGLHAGRDEFIFAPPGLGVFSQSDTRRVEDNPVYAMAGLAGPGDVDSLQLYDAFSPNLVFVLERFGFTGEGEALEWLQNGRIELGGDLPTNTAGGLLSEAHICGWGHMIEAARQLRGQAGARQVADCEIVQWATSFGDSLIFSKDR